MATTQTEVFTSTVDGLVDSVGATFGPSVWRVLSQDDVQKFADLTGDHNPIHIDPQAAAAGPFGQTIAHGYLTLSLVKGLMDPLFVVTDVATGINYGLERLRFPSPVPTGSRVRLRGEVVAASAIAGGAQITVRVTFEIENTEKPACVADVVLRFYK